MELPKLYSHYVTCIARNGEEETVHGLTSNSLYEYQEKGCPGGIFGFTPEENGQAVADEIAKRCNAHEALVQMVSDLLKSADGYIDSPLAAQARAMVNDYWEG